MGGVNQVVSEGADAFTVPRLSTAIPFAQRVTVGVSKIQFVGGGVYRRRTQVVGDEIGESRIPQDVQYFAGEVTFLKEPF